MKNTTQQILSILILSALLISGCSFTQTVAPGEADPIGMANPASLFCTEQGYRLEIRQSKDGGQTGYCIFPDGSECEEWAYFNGQCAPANQPPTTAPDTQPETDTTDTTAPADTGPISMPVYALYGSIVPSGAEIPAASQLIIYQDDVAPIFITGENGDLEAQIVAMQNKSEPGKNANFWGQLDCPTLDTCLLTVTAIRTDGPGAELPPNEVTYEGYIHGTSSQPHSGGDDYFAISGSLPFQYGLDSLDDTLRSQIEQYRDSGQLVRITGLLYGGRPDWNGTQIVLSSIEPVE